MPASFTTRSLTSGKSRAGGTAATEFVIVLPMMLLVVLGCLDLGRAVQHYSVMSNAAAAGAQRAAMSRFYQPYTRAAWEAQVRDTVEEELASLPVPLSAFEIRIATDVVAPSDDGHQQQSLPRITVSIDFDFPTTFRWPGFPQPLALHCESTIRQYR
jgi:hypothetical protein